MMENFLACQLIGGCVAPITLNPVEHDFQFALREAGVLTGSKHVVREANDQKVTDDSNA